MIKQKKQGAQRKQLIEGISPITYGWIDKKDKSIFYTTVGAHCKINNIEVGDRFIIKLETKLKKDIASLTRDIFPDVRYSIVDVNIPLNLIKTLRGFISVDVMINNTSNITNETIELYNRKIVDILLECDSITIFKTNKY